MAKFVASDRRAVTVEVEGARTGIKSSYSADKNGYFEVTNKQHIKAFKESDMVEASLMGHTSTSLGYDCAKCGFGSWFEKCGRCGHINAKSGNDESN